MVANATTIWRDAVSHCDISGEIVTCTSERSQLFFLALLFTSTLASASIVLTPVVSITPNGTTSANVTISFRAVASSPAAPVTEDVGFYHFNALLSGTSITSLNAAYNTSGLSVWSGLDQVDLNNAIAGVNPGISGLNISFKAGGPIGGVGSDPYNIAVPDLAAVTANNQIIGTITFTALVNGNFSVTTSALNTDVGGGLPYQNTSPGFSGFVQDTNTGGGFSQRTGVFNGANFSVTNIVAVPEPSSLLLIGVACVGFAARRFRRANRAV